MHHDKKASAISNFRIASDGSLKKRGGYTLYHTFPDFIRTFWEGTLQNKRYLFAVCGDGIYVVDDLSDTPTYIDSVRTTEGRLSFFEYEKELYLIDGDNFRKYLPATRSFPKVTPYIPLYGHNWNPSTGGTMNEPLNLLSNNARVQYSNPSNQTTFRLPFSCRRILGVRVNGTELTNYTFQSMTNVVTIPAESTGYSVEIAMEFVVQNINEDLLTAKAFALQHGTLQNTLCLYDTDRGYCIYPASPVAQGSLYASSVFDSYSAPLYFKNENIIYAGDAENPITAMTSYKNRLIAYSGLGAWEITRPNESKEALAVKPLLNGTTCLSPDAAIVVNETPVIVNQNGIYLLHLPASDNTPPTLERISDDVAEFLSADMAKHCLAWENKSHGEIWFRDTSDFIAPFLVYNQKQKVWYMFENIPATCIANHSDGACFACLEQLFLLSDTYKTDNGDEIHAVYQSGYLSFGRPEAQKRSLRLTVCAKCPDDSSFLELESEHGTRTFELTGTQGDCPDLFDFRALMGRFRFLRFRIYVGGEQDTRLYGLSFYANY